MDFLTHSLVGAGAARLLSSRREQLPQYSMAAVLGALLIDADPWLYLVDPAWYGLYHRVVTHSLVGMVGVALLSAAIAWLVFAWFWRRRNEDRFWDKARRFGWYVSPNLTETQNPARASYAALLMAATVGVLLHWGYDVITGFGNMRPFWPWSDYEASLYAVMSFDAVIFSSTLGWHILVRRLNWPRRKELWVSLAYWTLIIVYVAMRYASGVRTFI